MSQASTTDLEIEYPSSDGKPMAETDLHRDWMMYIFQMLSHHFAGQPVYISGNLLVYYVEGDPKRSVAPDAFVVKGLEVRRRRAYKIWEEGKVPNFVLETTSSSTRGEDLVHKPRRYAQLGVREYFLYDPLGEYLEPALLGYRLVGGGYIPLEMDEHQSIESEELGLIFRLEGTELVLIDKSTGARLKTDSERADDERAAREEIERRATEFERHAKEAERQAKDADARANHAEEQARKERAVREELEHEVARLKAGHAPNAQT